jgi:hypothetical protein
MTLSWLTKCVMTLSIAIVSILSLRAEEDLFTDPQPLVEAIQMLRAKRIPEAFFLLISPSLSVPITFAPDTKGGAFVLVCKESSVPDEEQATIEKSLDEAWQVVEGRMLRPKCDPVRKKLVFFEDEKWAGLLTSLKEYQVIDHPIAAWHVLEKDQQGLAIFEIPTGEEESFVRTFLKALALDGGALRYSIGWN